MPTRPTTPEQKADAARLRTLFEAWKSHHSDPQVREASQDEMAARLNISQSALSQRLTGRMAMSRDFAANVAALIGCDISDFSPALSNEIQQLNTRARATTPKVSEPPAQWRTGPTIAEALDRLGIELASTPPESREALATNMAGWARAGGVEPWHGLVLALLTPVASPAKRHGT